MRDVNEGKEEQGEYVLFEEIRLYDEEKSFQIFPNDKTPILHTTYSLWSSL